MHHTWITELLKSWCEPITSWGLDVCHGCYTNVQSHCSAGRTDPLTWGCPAFLSHCEPGGAQGLYFIAGPYLKRGKKALVFSNSWSVLRIVSFSWRGELLSYSMAPAFPPPKRQGPPLPGARSQQLHGDQLRASQRSSEYLKSFRKHSGLAKTMASCNLISTVR